MTVTGQSASGPAITAEEFLDGIRAVAPRIRERSAEAEALRCIPAATIADLDECGAFIGLQPRRWGGLELDPATFFRGIVLIGSACGASGWVASVLGAHPWEVGCMDPAAQADVWASNQRTRISSSYAPTGRAEKVVDGYSVNGEWRFSSGVDHCEWALLGAVVQGEEELGPRVLLVSRDDFDIDGESWNVSGLSGTGSKSIDVSDAVVPAYRTHLLSELLDPSRNLPGWEINPGPLYRLPWMNVFVWGIAGPALGAATGMVDEYVEQSRARTGAFAGSPVAKNSALHIRLAEARHAVDGMTRSMISHWDELMAAAASDEPIDELMAARARYAGGSTIIEALDAALIVFAQAGGGVMALDNPLQRYLRDLLAMRNHPIASIERFASEQAVLELGLG